MRRVAIFIAIAGAVIGLIVSLYTVYQVAGGWGLFFGLLLFPLTFAYLPIYTLFVYGSWNLLLLNYGSIALSWILLYVADQREELRSAIEEPPTQPVVTKENPSPAVVFLIIGGVIFAAIICALVLRAI